MLNEDNNDEKSRKLVYCGTPWDIRTPKFIQSKYGNLNCVYYLNSKEKKLILFNLILHY